MPAGIDWPRSLAARGAQMRLRPEHLRPALRAAPRTALHCFVLDASASMLAGQRLALAKGLLAELMTHAYRQRDRVALIVFSGQGVALHLPPQRASHAPRAWLTPIGGGGGTPLTAALARADALLARHLQQHPHGSRWLWLLSDARTRETPPRPGHAHHIQLIDFDCARPALGRAAQLAALWQARYWPAAALCR